MQIKPVSYQPNYKGKLVFEKETTKKITMRVSDLLCQKYKEISHLVSEKPYDIFILQNKQNPEFYNIAANKSIEEAKKIKEYTVKVQSNVFADSIVDAAKDAMEMYEKYINIAKNI